MLFLNINRAMITVPCFREHVLRGDGDGGQPGGGGAVAMCAVPRPLCRPLGPAVRRVPAPVAAAARPVPLRSPLLVPADGGGERGRCPGRPEGPRGPRSLSGGE